ILVTIDVSLGGTRRFALDGSVPEGQGRDCAPGWRSRFGANHPTYPGPSCRVAGRRMGWLAGCDYSRSGHEAPPCRPTLDVDHTPGAKHLDIVFGVEHVDKR